MSPFELVLKLFLQLAVILAACRIVGWLVRHVGQTPVIGEMIAGVMLGPSIFGLLAPGAQQWLFPQTAVVELGATTTTIAHPSMLILHAISQLGLVLYMFLVGLEFDGGMILGRVRSAGLVSTIGVLVPFALGASVALLLQQQGGFFAPQVSAGAAALYLGACLSITAFPVLARILHDKGVSGTRLGTLTLAAGAIDDAIAWCLLATVLAVLHGSPAIALLALGGGVVYVLSMIGIGRPILRVFERWAQRDGGITPAAMVSVLLIVMLAAWLTDVIGIYAVFGAFVAGAVMPRGRFSREFSGHVKLLTVSLLVPVFFVYAGLNTRVELIDSAALWLLTALILVVAIVGKGVACTLAARAAHEPWRDALAIGTLMNARGLMELIILNIGLQQGIITGTLFTILALMTLVTTLMASPLFQWIYKPPVVDAERARPRVVASAD